MPFFFLAQHIFDVFIFLMTRERQHVAFLEQAIDVYTTEFERFIKFMGYSLFFLHYVSRFTSLSY